MSAWDIRARMAEGRKGWDCTMQPLRVADVTAIVESLRAEGNEIPTSTGYMQISETLAEAVDQAGATLREFHAAIQKEYNRLSAQGAQIPDVISVDGIPNPIATQKRTQELNALADEVRRVRESGEAPLAVALSTVKAVEGTVAAMEAHNSFKPKRKDSRQMGALLTDINSALAVLKQEAKNLGGTLTQLERFKTDVWRNESSVRMMVNMVNGTPGRGDPLTKDSAHGFAVDEFQRDQ